MATNRDWPELARALGAIIPRDSLDRSVLRWIAQNEPGAWSLAVSGGGDSVAMTLLLWEHFPDCRNVFRIAHLDHGLRGSESAADAAFVRELGAALQIPVRIECSEWEDSRSPSPSEAALRKRRWDFLLKGCQHEPIAAFFLGHHADDVAETILMRVARGSTLSGVSAPRPVQRFRSGPPRLRPLLGLRKTALLKALEMVGAPWREDASNASIRYTRNQFRHVVLPTLTTALGRDPVRSLNQTRAWLEEEDEALEHWVTSLPIAIDDLNLPREPFERLPRAIWRRALTRWLFAHGVGNSVSAATRDRLLEAWVAKKRWRSSAGNWIIESDASGLRLHPVPAEPRLWKRITINAKTLLFLPCGSALRWERVELDAAARAHILGRNLDPDQEAYLAFEEDEPFPDNLVIRQWRPADRFRPLGHPGRAKLQDLFTNRKVPCAERMQRPVVCMSDGSILWIPGIPSAHDRKVFHETRWALRLTYMRPARMVSRNPGGRNLPACV